MGLARAAPAPTAPACAPPAAPAMVSFGQGCSPARHAGSPCR